MSKEEPTSVADRRRSLSTRHVVFVVIAAAAPMAAMVGNVPVAFLYGNGPGLPVAFALAGAALLCFCVGYAAMSRRVVNTGAFYTYVARGIGKPPAVGAAYLAVLSYTALTIGLAGAFGYFIQLASDNAISWEIPSAVAITIVGVLGYRSADLSAKVLGVLMLLEFAVLIVFDTAVGIHKGADALPLASLEPHNIFSGSIGIALMFAFTSFVGFESGALYGEETSNPEKSIPKATYIAVASVGIFYFLTTWFAVGSFGVNNTHEAAVAAKAASTPGNDKLGNLIIDQGTKYAGSAFGSVMGLLLLTSLLASMLAVHNASSRYLFALGRERVLPGSLGRYHGKFLSPHVGSLTVTAITTIVVAAFAIGGLDPYLNLATSMIGLSTLGVVLLQVLAGVSIVAFFRRRGERSYWRTLIFPAIGSLALAVAFVLAVLNFKTLVNSDNAAVTSVPWLLPIVLVAGLITAWVLKRRHPGVYTKIAQSTLRSRPRTLAAPTTWTRRYCVIGAGPAGLVAARALRAQGIPFDWYERSGDVGGIWNADAPGSPIYDSAHFISSKYQSGFVGHPMPADFPDYPSWRQIRAYINEFADVEELRPLITFHTSVTSAVPVGDEWDVTLSDGSTRRYAGIVAAPGVNWHPHLASYPGQDVFDGEIRHSSTFTDPAEFAGKRVLVVGGGNSGVDIACDAARSASAAYLSVRRGYRYIPKHIAGVPTDALLAGKVDPPRGVSLPTDPQAFLDALVGDLTRYGLPKPDHELLSSHPILNTQVLHYLGHGDLIAKPDVARFTPTGVEFTDGTSVEVDVVILATGYTYALPFLADDLLPWRGGRPELYLNIFSRDHDGLAVLGFIEFADAAYERFEEMAHMIVLDITAREVGGDVWAAWSARKASDRPDLRGGKVYLDSPRHANYVDAETYQVVLADIRDRFGVGEVPTSWARPAQAPATPQVPSGV
jgi:amino acid transporter